MEVIMLLNLDHKKLLLSNRISFLIAGFCIAAWAPMIPFVRERFALNEHDLGLLLLCVGIGSFVSMPTSGYFSARFGCKKPIIIAAILISLCLVSIPLINNLYVLAAVLFFMGVNSVFLDVISNINAALVEQYTKRDVMSGLHGLYSVGGFLGSMSVTFLLSMNFPFLYTGMYAAVIIIACALLGCRDLFNTVHLPDEEEAHATDSKPSKENSNKTSKWAYYTNPTVLLIGLMCFIMFMTEGSMLDWSGVFLRLERGLSLEHAGYGFATFSIFMTIFRLTGDKIVSTFGRGRVIIFGTLLIVAGFLVAVSIPHYIAAFVGFALIGMGASNVVPQLVSITARIKEVPTHISVTIVNAIGFSGILIGPAFIGFLAHAITLPYTYLVQATGVLFVTVMTVILIKHLKKNHHPH